MILRGVLSDPPPGVTVEAEVYPIESATPGHVLRRPYRFGTAEQAMRFVEEALVALEYLDCSIA